MPVLIPSNFLLCQTVILKCFYFIRQQPYLGQRVGTSFGIKEIDADSLSVQNIC